MDKQTRRRAFFEALDVYPYGTQYHRAPTPTPDEWEGDLSRLAEKGYTHVQFRPQWRWHERVRGEATWDDLDRLFDLAQGVGLRVVLKPMLETAPDWVFQQLDGTRIGFNGIPIMPVSHAAYYVGGWWPCFDNPAVVETAGRFVEEMTARYKDHPALWFYDAWNEPRSRPLGQCHCEHSTASYQRWLARRYDSIEALNEHLGKAWTSFESIRAPEGPTDYAETVLWRQWAAQSVADQVAFVERAIRRVHPEAVVMVHVGGSAVVTDAACDTSDDLLTSQTTDLYGTSFHVPLHPVTPTECNAPEVQSSWLRRVDPKYWVHEFYPNRANWCRPPEPRVLGRLIWMAIAGGATGFTYWQYRSERFGTETNGFGLVDMAGRPTPRSDVAERVAAALKQHGRELNQTTPVPNEAALVYSRHSDLVGRVQEMNSPLGYGFLEMGTDRYFYKQALQKAHALYATAGMPVDMAVPGDDVSGRKLLHVGAAEMIDAEAAAWLTDYVGQGGTLVVECPFACRDERTWALADVPAHNLHQLLGCREADRVVTLEERPDRVTLGGATLAASHWRIELEPTGGEVLATWQDGAPAVVHHRVGQGQVLTLGINLSLAFEDRWDDPVLVAWTWMLERLGLVEQSMPTERDLRVMVRLGDGMEVIFAFNVGSDHRSLPLGRAKIETWDSDGGEVSASGVVDLEPGGFWVGCVKT